MSAWQSDVERRLAAIEKRTRSIPARWAGGGGDPTPPVPATMRYLPGKVAGWSVIGAQTDPFLTPDAPVNWKLTDLPITFRHGDQLPIPATANRLKSQMGYVRLSLPSEFLDGKNGRAGDPDAFYGEEVDTDPGVSPILVRAEIRGVDKLHLWFDKNVEIAGSIVPPETWSDYATMSNLAAGPAIPLTITAGGGGETTNEIVLTIAGATAAQWETIAVAGDVTVSLVRYAPGVMDHESIIVSSGPNTETTEVSGFICVFGNDRDAYVYAMNRVWNRALPLETHVNVAARSYLDLEDEQEPPNIRRVYDLTVGAAAAVVTLFLVEGSDILLTIGPTNYRGVQIQSALSTGAHPQFVPTAAPPTSGFPVALGRARLGDPNVGPYVWVGTRLRPGGVGASQNDLNSYLPNGSTILSRRHVMMPVGSAAGTEFVAVYLPYRA